MIKIVQRRNMCNIYYQSLSFRQTTYIDQYCILNDHIQLNIKSKYCLPHIPDDD
jgi:hypothetical protein